MHHGRRRPFRPLLPLQPAEVSADEPYSAEESSLSPTLHKPPGADFGTAAAAAAADAAV
eukprot:CAMPEP_0172839494 /NCGR_PEP_ID=MMETSP1075-20121228/28611_1 /TAXON_ID=2916 /ORGANISM="Ceratium fusus, Strain PA161109" /LENGTH=58 /DNA_ID=CAMNT_0013683151 /DNA_START=281 /DNA_END=453 /DNA_ORIENTATION=+